MELLGFRHAIYGSCAGRCGSSLLVPLAAIATDVEIPRPHNIIGLKNSPLVEVHNASSYSRVLRDGDSSR